MPIVIVPIDATDEEMNKAFAKVRKKTGSTALTTPKKSRLTEEGKKLVKNKRQGGKVMKKKMMGGGKKSKYMAKGGMKKSKYMAKGGMKKSKYMSKGGRR